MTFERMLAALRDIESLETDLMRPLTEQEKNIVMDEGIDYFVFNTLGFNLDEYDALLKVRHLISAFCTETEDTYDRVLAECKNPKVKEIMQEIINDLEKDEEVESDEKIGTEQDLNPTVVNYPIGAIDGAMDEDEIFGEPEPEKCEKFEEPEPKPVEDYWTVSSTDEHVVSYVELHNALKRLKAGEVIKCTPEKMKAITDYIKKSYPCYSIYQHNDELKAKFC